MNTQIETALGSLRSFRKSKSDLLSLDMIRVFIVQVAAFRVAIRSSPHEHELEARVYQLGKVLEEVHLEEARAKLCGKLRIAFVAGKESIAEALPNFAAMADWQHFHKAITPYHVSLRKEAELFREHFPSHYENQVNKVNAYLEFVSSPSQLYEGISWGFSDLIASAEDFFKRQDVYPEVFYYGDLEPVLLEWITTLRNLRDQVTPKYLLECSIIDRCNMRGCTTKYADQRQEAFLDSDVFHSQPEQLTIEQMSSRIPLAEDGTPRWIVKKELVERIISAAEDIARYGGTAVGATERCDKRWHTPDEDRPARYQFPLKGEGSELSEAYMPLPDGELRRRPELDNLYEANQDGTIWLIRLKPQGHTWEVWFSLEQRWQEAHKNLDGIRQKKATNPTNKRQARSSKPKTKGGQKPPKTGNNG